MFKQIGVAKPQYFSIWFIEILYFAGLDHCTLLFLFLALIFTSSVFENFKMADIPQDRGKCLGCEIDVLEAVLAQLNYVRNPEICHLHLVKNVRSYLWCYFKHLSSRQYIAQGLRLLWAETTLGVKEKISILQFYMYLLPEKRFIIYRIVEQISFLHVCMYVCIFINNH